MKETFIPKKFTVAHEEMLAKINPILAQYDAASLTLTTRQLYYQLVARDIIPNNMRSYKNTADLVSVARLAGRIDWAMIEDRGRVSSKPSTWGTPADIIRSAVASYRIDKWTTQPVYVEVMVEKQALEGVLEPVCAEFGVMFTANKGYSSSSAVYECAQRFRRAARAGKERVILYFGDHDPSGVDMTRDILERIHLMTRHGCDVRRLALNMPQIEEFNPPENPAKLTDSRATGYIAQYGDSSWELDALDPETLAGLVRSEIEGLIDQSQWDIDTEREERGTRRLQDFADTYRE